MEGFQRSRQEDARHARAAIAAIVAFALAGATIGLSVVTAAVHLAHHIHRSR